MAIVDILQEPSRALRARVVEIGLEEVSSKKIKSILRDMSDTLNSIDVGVGLAAPQIGHSIRIFIASEEALMTERDKDLDQEKLKKNKVAKRWKHFVFINPKIIKISKKRVSLPEGCLSVNDSKGDTIYGKVLRAEKITVEAYNENGKKFRVGASKLFAQVLQHELDHLEGILFIDHATELKTLKKVVEAGK